MRQTIDGALYRRMILSADAVIGQNLEQINELNVFPVPDGDTGTNMSMTLSAAAKDLRGSDEPNLSKAADITANALLRGARGNSGVILSLLFRGFSKALKGKETGNGEDFASALTAGVEAAYKAVMKPAEGTILTVARMTADCARDLAKEDDSVEYVLQNALDTARAALDNTVNQNPVLKKAGVVDAGGMGFVKILEGMLSSVQGNDVICAQSQERTKQAADFSDFCEEDITFTYCTEFIVRRENDRDPEALRAFLCEMGDSLVLVDDEEIIKVHVHTNHPGTVFEEALKYGQFVTTKVENMRLQHTEKVINETDLAEKITKRYGSVAVCAGAGLADIFRDLGVDAIVEGGQTMNPSTQDILKAVGSVPAEVVFVLPNNKNIIMAAQAAAELSKKQVIVIPSRTVPQGITAMLSLEPSLEPEEIEQAMTESLQTVTTMQMTYAARDSEFDGSSITAGDYLAMYEGSLMGTSKDSAQLLDGMIEKIRELDKSFVNIFSGAELSQEDAENALRRFTEKLPDAEVNLVRGDQPIYYYLVSAE